MIKLKNILTEVAANRSWDSQLWNSDIWNSQLWPSQLWNSSIWPSDMWNSQIWNADTWSSDVWNPDAIKSKNKELVPEIENHPRAGKCYELSGRYVSVHPDAYSCSW